MIPAFVVIAVLHALVIISIVRINYYSSQMSGTMRDYADYISDVNALQADSSLLSETASIYVMMPMTEDGAPNVGPLISYCEELAGDRRSDLIAGRFADYDVGEEIRSYVQQAADHVAQMMESQSRAIALTASVHPLPDLPSLAELPKVDLPESERAAPEQERLTAAVETLFGEEYSNHKKQVSQNARAAIAALRSESGQKVGRAADAVMLLRTMLWVETLAVMAILVLVFSALYRHLIRPLTGFVRMIDRDDPLKENSGLFEIRRLTAAYNGLLRRRENLEATLRGAAETDELTKLPNRHGFDHYLDGLSYDGKPVAVFSFDLNGLKETNDTLGHLAGDDLLCAAASCIVASFGAPAEDNCFRFGGDEFVAVVTDCTTRSLTRQMEDFRRRQSENRVSIAMGYACGEPVERHEVRDLYLEADRNMYAQKITMRPAEAE